MVFSLFLEKLSQFLLTKKNVSFRQRNWLFRAESARLFVPAGKMARPSIFSTNQVFLGRRTVAAVERTERVPLQRPQGV
jgi:hypothetical protein